jgi:hypothetical protein
MVQDMQQGQHREHFLFGKVAEPNAILKRDHFDAEVGRLRCGKKCR